jgi:membrane protease YdiL (CAAX protease family)
MELVISPTFTSMSTLLGLALLAYLAVGEPLLGRWAYARLAAARDRDPRALVRFFALTLAVEWGTAALVGAIALLSPGIRAADLGMRAPSGDSHGFAAGFVGALVAGVAIGAFMHRRAARGRPIPGQKRIAAMLPRTAGERGLGLAVALSAGICEELVYRGFAIALGVGLFGLPVAAAAVLSCAIFGVGHIYQGAAGAITVTVLSGVFALLYVATGSLLLPVILHAAIDIRSLVLMRAPPDDGPATACRTS